MTRASNINQLFPNGALLRETEAHAHYCHPLRLYIVIDFKISTYCVYEIDTMKFIFVDNSDCYWSFDRIS